MHVDFFGERQKPNSVRGSAAQQATMNLLTILHDIEKLGEPVVNLLGAYLDKKDKAKQTETERVSVLARTRNRYVIQRRSQQYRRKQHRGIRPDGIRLNCGSDAFVHQLFSDIHTYRPHITQLTP